MNITERIRQVDAYPKTLEDFRVKTCGGAIVTIISSIIILILFISELNDYFTPSLNEELFVDTSRSSKLRINLDVVVSQVSCDLLSLDAMDTTGEQHLQIEHNIYKRRLDLTGKPIQEPQKTEIATTKKSLETSQKSIEQTAETTTSACGSCYGAEDKEMNILCCNTCAEVREAYSLKRWALPQPMNFKQCENEFSQVRNENAFSEGCQIYGYMEVSRVGGSFHIAPGSSFSMSHVHVHNVQPYSTNNFNLTHTIRHLSFGVKIPGKTNPIDNTLVIAPEGESSRTFSDLNFNNIGVVKKDMISYKDVANNDDGSACENLTASSSEVKEKMLEERKSYNQDYEKVRKRQLELLAQKREKDGYEKALSENRYKRLQHLVKQSQFYIERLLNPKPVANNKEAKKKKPNTRKRANNNKPCENKSENVRTKKKRKLSDGDIAELLSQEEDEEEDDENKNPNIGESSEIKVEKLTLGKNELHKVYKASKYFIGELFDFQKVGVQWLLRLRENGLNGILADEMGLGKTIQVIALFTHLMESSIDGNNLIIAPLSTLGNWMYEFERFAPELKVILYHGSDRHALWPQIKTSYNLRGIKEAKPIVLTSYEQVVKDKLLFTKPMFNYLVIDEGQRIKNHEAALSKIVRKVKAINRLLLTGTPLQNNLCELWSLLNFLMPEIFDDLDLFVSWFEVQELQSSEGRAHILKLEQEKNVLGSFREILNPFMLRRLKDQVGLKIPPKKEVIVYCPLTEIQHNLYLAVLKRDINALQMINHEPVEQASVETGKRPKRMCRMIKECPELIPQYKLEALTKAQIQTMQWKTYIDVDSRNVDYLLNITPHSRATNYKKIVNHPYLIHQPLEYGSQVKIDENTINSSGKLMVLDKMLEKLYASGHKVLIFSTWVMILDIIEDYLSLKPYKYCRLQGSHHISERIQNIQSFNTDPAVFLFLISTRAGGVGLNLMAADTVIIYDSDWNPQADIQAMARCHRVGQTRPVMIYRFCTKGTIDEEIVNRSAAKLKLEKAVMEDHVFSKEALIHLQSILENDHTNVVQMDQSAISDAELDKLLDRSQLLDQMKAEEKDE